jgi:hypothetical protein
VRVAHYYHVWAEGAWAPPASEHHEALREAGFPVLPRVGVTGDPADRQRFAGWAAAHGWEIVAEADKGYEQVTLSALRAWVLEDTEPAAIFYAHAKGSHHDAQGTNTTWRREMTRRLVGEWRTIQLLLGRHEAVGCSWKPAADYPQMDLPGSGFFAGNFWWATRDFLRKLPEPGVAGRYGAEEWIGLGHPDAVDLLPGWSIYMLKDGAWGVIPRTAYGRGDTVSAK